MMPQLIVKTKIYFYIFLLLILASIHNINYLDNLGNFFKIKKIILETNTQETLKQDILHYLKKYYNKNIFHINSSEISNLSNEFSFIGEFTVKKEYPSAIKIKIKKTKILAYYFEDNQKIYIGENGKKIIDKNFVNDELPFIHGNVDIKNFLKLIKKLEINEFKLRDFNHFYFFKSKRWDLVYKDKITIKLPINDLNNSIILLKQIFEKSNLNEIKIIDLRLKNKIIIS